MAWVKYIGLAVFASILSACVSTQRVTLTGCDHYSRWCNEIRTDAARAYPYAQMSANAYDDASTMFDLGPDYKNHHNAQNDELGFAYSIFHRLQNGKLAEVIIAYRGTQFTSGRDWAYGNILLRQNARGQALYDIVRAQVDAIDPAIPVNVTGHSLGGGIATQVSLWRENVDSYIFNSSPRFKAPPRPMKNNRLSIVERGELLKAVRLLGREATQDYISINCSPGFRPLGKHSMRPLAECLTDIAAYEVPAARESLIRNKIPPREVPHRP